MAEQMARAAVVDVMVPVLMGFISTSGPSQGGTASNLVDKCIEGLREAAEGGMQQLRGMLCRF